jgi:hypothetical protein
VSAKRLFVLLAMIVGAAWTMDVAWHGADLALRGRTWRETLQSGSPPNPSAVDWEQLTTDLTAVETDLRALRIDLSPLWWIGGRVNPTWRVAPALLDAGADLAEGSSLVGAVAGAVVAERDSAASDLSPEARLERVTSTLADHAEQLTLAAERLERAQQKLDTISAADLDPRVQRIVSRIRNVLPLATTGLRLAGRSPVLLGFDRPRHYLILAQNNDEVRATGGFISGVGLVTLERGRITALQFGDSYIADNFDKPHPMPPTSLKKAMGIELWVVRDANWSPDFPTDAKVAAQIYGIDHEMTVDGVIAIDMVFLQNLVGAVGPLRLEGYPEEITADNLFPLMRYYWGPLSMGFTLEQWEKMTWKEQDRLWFPHRKDFVQKVSQTLMSRLLAGAQGRNLPTVVRTVLQSLHERHLLVYLFDEEAQKEIAAQEWDGAILPSEGDYLQVVDSNIGYNKVNAKVTQTITHQVSIKEDGRVMAVTRLHYRHAAPPADRKCAQVAVYDPTYEQMTRRCYWDYVRLYVPAGTLLLGLTGAESREVAEEAGKTVLASRFVLKPGQEQTVVFRYVLPPGTVKAEGEGLRYRLLWQKQSGTLDTSFQVVVNSPHGYEIESATPNAPILATGAVEFAGRLRTDRSFEVTFRRN